MKDQAAKTGIIIWADIIRVVAIFLVVMIHVSGQVTDLWGKVPENQWMIANIYGGTARVAVPLFFMISGYLLLPRSEPLGAFYSKRMLKILIPFLVWSSLYLGWYCVGHPGTCTFAFGWNLLLTQGTYYHLWFLYAILNIYLILPILRLMIRPGTDEKILWYLILLWLIFQPVVATANKFWDFSFKIRPPLTTGFVCFFILGYLFGQMPLSRAKTIGAAVTWGVGTLITIVGTLILTRSTGQFDGFFYDYLSLNVIFASSAAFLLLRRISETKLLASPELHSAARSLATAAFGIYLIHIIIIEVLNDTIHVSSSMGNTFWSIPLVCTIVFICSFLIVRLMQKIPVLKQIVPG